MARSIRQPHSKLVDMTSRPGRRRGYVSSDRCLRNGDVLLVFGPHRGPLSPSQQGDDADLRIKSAKEVL